MDWCLLKPFNPRGRPVLRLWREQLVNIFHWAIFHSAIFHSAIFHSAIFHSAIFHWAIFHWAFMASCNPTTDARPRHGVVAVITHGHEFLVIRRSQHVRAPGAFCFPGGGVETGETEPEALQRELQEELAANARIIRRMWNNQTPSGVHLAWWRAELDDGSPLTANPQEVESIHWFSSQTLRQLPNVLSTNLEFLAALDRNEIVLDL